MNYEQEMKKRFPKMEKLFNPDILKQFAKFDDVTEFNIGIGTMIRLKFLRPDNILRKAFVEAGITDVDEMTMIVLKEFWEYLQ
jgi:hypothetical protein